MSPSPLSEPISSIQHCGHPDSEPQYDQRQVMYLAGVGMMHSIAAPIHNFIAQSLEKPWKFLNQECETVEKVVELFRQPNFAGGVVTMPYKATIMKHLDGIDDIATKTGACNNVYLTSDGKLWGTNTDWRGVLGSLLHSGVKGQGKPALIIGAGGACRAAVYTLHAKLGCYPIYIMNRDVTEVEALQDACRAYVPPTEDGQDSLVHVVSVEQAGQLARPYFIISTVPDTQPVTQTEKLIPAMLTAFLANKYPSDEGVLLDMCYKPPITSNMKLARKMGWQTEDGTNIVGDMGRRLSQLATQCR